MKDSTRTPQATTGSPRYFHIGTTCSGSMTDEHKHDVPSDAVTVAPRVRAVYSCRPVLVKKAPDGRLYRIFGSLNYDTATGETLITEFAGATDQEQRCLLATAVCTDPAAWQRHPCVPGRNRVSVCGYVDDSYLDAAAEILFTDLTEAEQTSALDSWSGGLQLI
ncbi:hypothetical protein ACIQCM_08800 [Pseudarthrobacter sp. NPDC092439]|uniref:hypothetical protein n=1 Tax=unclassified Pseudarthrobacter TaxID=2647000 RepID=UPI00380894C5